jgi:hypothetical protein
MRKLTSGRRNITLMFRKDDTKHHLPVILLGCITRGPPGLQILFLFAGYSLREVYTVDLLARVGSEMCSHGTIVLKDSPAVLAKDSDMSPVNMFPVQDLACA